MKDQIIRDIRNLFRLEKNQAIKYRILRDIKNVLEHEEEENYYKPVITGNFLSNNYIKYKRNSDKKKTLSVAEYLYNIAIMFNGEVDEVIYELLKSVKKRYKNNLEWIKGREFVFAYAHTFDYTRKIII